MSSSCLSDQPLAGPSRLWDSLHHAKISYVFHYPIWLLFIFFFYWNTFFLIELFPDYSFLFSTPAVIFYLYPVQINSISVFHSKRTGFQKTTIKDDQRAYNKMKQNLLHGGWTSQLNRKETAPGADTRVRDLFSLRVNSPTKIISLWL